MGQLVFGLLEMMKKSSAWVELCLDLYEIDSPLHVARINRPIRILLIAAMLEIPMKGPTAEFALELPPHPGGSEMQTTL